MDPSTPVGRPCSTTTQEPSETMRAFDAIAMKASASVHKHASVDSFSQAVGTYSPAASRSAAAFSAGDLPSTLAARSPLMAATLIFVFSLPASARP